MSKKFKLNFDLIAIFVIIIISMLYYNVVINSPIIFGDEGNYASHARWIARNMLIPKESVLIADTYHQPFISKPIFYLFEAFGWILLGEIGVKLLIPIFSILTAFIIYLFLKEFERPRAGLVAAFLFLMTPSLITYGVMGYVDTLLCLLLISSAYFLYKSFHNQNKIYTILSGIFFGLSVITKPSSLPFFIPLLLIYFIFFERKKWKNLILIFIIALLVVAPWQLVRNPILFGDICYSGLGEFSSSSNCAGYGDIKTEKIDGLEFAGRNPGGGTEADILKIGLLSYFRFAYGWTIPIIFLFSLSFVILRKKKIDLFLILWFLLQIIFLFYLGYRAEDTARYMLPMILSMVMLCGIFVSNIFDYLKKYHIILALIIILIFSYSSWIYGQEKLDTMIRVKQFVPGVFDACDWMKQNTPEDSTFITSYAQQVAYQCDRKMAGLDENGGKIAILANDNRSYNTLKIFNVNYIYIIESLIAIEAYTENHPLAFVQYIDSSDHFKLVYDNRNKFGQAGVRIYEVLN